MSGNIDRRLKALEARVGQRDSEKEARYEFLRHITAAVAIVG
jgi:hypothetical protein